tara:strand:+ start:1092 stop:1706 length:615 start_codon:yes stop_codon:yes gene_type:complete
MENNNEPWKEKGSIWKSKSAYWTWIRGQLRRAASRYPIKNAFIYANRFSMANGKFKNGNTKIQWGGECNHCEETFILRKLAVDHIIPAGSLLDPSQLEEHITRLFCSYENFQFLCKECHDKKSLRDNLLMKGVDISAKDAERAKKWILIKNLKVEPLRKWLSERGAEKEEMKNKATRETFLANHFNIWWVKPFTKNTQAKTRRP